MLSPMKKGFTVIELAIVLLIIGIALTVGIPRFGRIRPKPGEQFIVNLSALTQEASRQAQYQSKVQKVLFDFMTHKVELWDIDGKKEKKFIIIPDALDIKDFLINQKSQFGADVKKHTAYFLINAQGITQDVKIFFIDHSIQTRGPNAGSYEIVLNPITAQFNRA